MKKFVTIFLTLFLAVFLPAFSFEAGFDLRSSDSFFRDGIRVDGEIGFETESFKITIPVRYGKSKDYDISLIESGVLVSVHPWPDIGFFAEASLVKVGYLWGLYAPGERLYFAAEGSVGWNFVFGHFYIRPKYTFRSSLSGEDTKEERIKVIPQFDGGRISLYIGFTSGGVK